MMDSYILLQGLLTCHLSGLVVMAGTTLIDYTTFRTFWKQVDKENKMSMSMLKLMEKFSRLAGIGAAILILTGVGMMALTGGAFGEQLWFRIKFGLVIILILNSLFIGRRLGIKLRKAVENDLRDAAIGIFRVSLTRFYLIQLLIFFSIIFLSVFKFN